MRMIQFELFRQAAIFTLKHDLQLTEGQIKAFERTFPANVYEIGEMMIKNAEKQQEAFQQNKFNKYIQE